MSESVFTDKREKMAVNGESTLICAVRGQTLEVTEDVAYQNQDGLTGWRKTQGNWVVEIGGRVPGIEDAGDICLRRPRSTQGCRADDDDNDDDSCRR